MTSDVWVGTRDEWETRERTALPEIPRLAQPVRPKAKPGAGAPHLKEAEEERQFLWALEKLDANPRDAALANNLLAWAKRTMTGDRLAVLVETASGYLAAQPMRRKKRRRRRL